MEHNKIHVSSFTFQVTGYGSERGVSLYIAFMIMTILLGIAFGMSSLLFSQLGILKGMGHSVFAFYATEAGLERALYLDNTVCLEAEDHASCLAGEFGSLDIVEDLTLSNGAVFELQAELPGQGGCPDALGYSYCVKATGSYKEARRAVRMAR